MAKSEKKQPERLLLRLPRLLRQRIEENAKVNDRTMTAEILLRLEAAYRLNSMSDAGQEREYIVVSQLEQAMTKSLAKLIGSSSFTPRLLPRLERIKVIIETLQTFRWVNANELNRHFRAVDLLVTEVIDLDISNKATEFCWRLRIHLGKFLDSTDDISRDSQCSLVRDLLSQLMRELEVARSAEPESIIHREDHSGGRP